MDCQSIDELAAALTATLQASRSVIIFAPNSTGKTRLSQHLKEADPDGVVLYNAILEDMFIWDNERFVLKIDTGSDLVESIVTQGLDAKIGENFQVFTRGKIEPTIDLDGGEVSFGIHTGDKSSVNNIKISRAEESLFVWCVYFSVLGDAVDTLSDQPELRTTRLYDGLKVAVIDDPVSSMDDERVVAVALAIVDLVRRAADLEIRFVISTHHALFFNVLFNALGAGRDKKCDARVLNRGLSGGWTLRRQPRDSPFSYHLAILREIEDAIGSNSVKRVHFNQFRTLLEKTSNFLGYTGGWSDLLVGPDRAILARVLNLYSHDRLAELDYAEVPSDYVEAFTAEFRKFTERFGWAMSRNE